MQLKNLLLVAAFTGLSACVTAPTTSGLCDGLRSYERAARTALLEHEATVHDDVGEAVTDLIIALRGGCGW